MYETLPPRNVEINHGHCVNLPKAAELTCEPSQLLPTAQVLDTPPRSLHLRT